MARIRMLTLEELDPELRRRVEEREKAGMRGIPRIDAHQPEMARAQEALGRAVLKNCGLPPRLVELVRLRIAFHNQCRTCMSVRYRAAIDDGLNENLVCSLEQPETAPDLSEAERAALRYADLFATDHLAIDDAVHDALREHFSEKHIVGLGYLCAISVGFGRLAATWDVVEALPAGFAGQQGVYTPWGSPDPVPVGRDRST